MGCICNNDINENAEINPERYQELSNPQIFLYNIYAFIFI